MENNKFIDLNGLKLIWSKIDNSLTTANTKITELTKEVETLKEQVDNMGTIPPVQQLPEGYVCAKGSDFKWETDYPWNGAWHYVGNNNKMVAIPNTIQGLEVTSYRGMFYQTSVSGVYSDNTNVTDMTHMFESSAATSLDLRYLETSGATDMSFMFYKSQATSLNLSSLNTSNVKDMRSMLSYSKATTLDLSSFDTSNVTNMSDMFFGVEATNLNLSRFNTSKVKNMSNMFCEHKATTLDLSSFDTSNVTDMKSMFAGSTTTTGYAKTQEDADRFNVSSKKPSALTFVVKQ